jgi:hypothetical protein
VIRNAAPEVIHTNWNIAYIDFGKPDFDLTITRTDYNQPFRTDRKLIGVSDMDNGRNLIDASVALAAAGTVTLPVAGQLLAFALLDSVHHLGLEYEIFDLEKPAVIPSKLGADTHGIIYAIAHNNDLLWFHHEGWQDGSFTWQYNEGKKVGNGWDVTKVFPG